MFRKGVDPESIEGLDDAPHCKKEHLSGTFYLSLLGLTYPAQHWHRQPCKLDVVESIRISILLSKRYECVPQDKGRLDNLQEEDHVNENLETVIVPRIGTVECHRINDCPKIISC